MADSAIAELLQRLGSREPQPAWDSFLETYSALIYQVARSFEREADEAEDCFLFICEQLRRERFRRLRRFRPDGRASFPTWLRAVVRNLCLDWRRRRYGRYRVFRSVTRLSDFDQQVFRQVLELGLSAEECVEALNPKFAAVSLEQVEASLQRLRSTLSPHQSWLLDVRRSRWQQRSGGETPGSRELEDPSPDPEAQAVLKEDVDEVRRALARLAAQDRLLLLLRYEQELTLAEVARVLALKDAQTADRRIREALARLREHLGTGAGADGKVAVKSV